MWTHWDASPLRLACDANRSYGGHRVKPRTLLLVVLTVIGCGRPSSNGSRAASLSERFGLGSTATGDAIDRWNTDVRADGSGLPDDSGTAVEGATIFAGQCAVCHGADGAHGAVPPAPLLVGRIPGDAFPFATDTTAVPTVGNYWPYATTLYDYISRAMPFPSPGSLTPHQVYALTAFILVKNQIVPANTVLNARTLPQVRMPARNRFVPDDRTGGREVR
jgi:S-disulfanyl-L-cysteine oxidoreductase SoxD